MELLDKGKHCSEEFCHQLDLLPIKCKACFNFYCTEHFKYESHNCKQSNKYDYKIPTCELCNKTIEFKRGLNLDICLADHLEKCKIRNNLDLKEKIVKKCSYKNCKSKEIFVFECETCCLKYCTKHRIPESHKCVSNNQSCSAQFRQIYSNEFKSYTASSC